MIFKDEIKENLFDIFRANKRIDEELTKIKIAIHNLDKLGHDTTALEKKMDDVGIAFYQLKQIYDEKREELLK